MIRLRHLRGNIKDVYDIILRQGTTGVTRVEIERNAHVSESMAKAHLASLQNLDLITSKKDMVRQGRGPGMSLYFPTDRRIS